MHIYKIKNEIHNSITKGFKRIGISNLHHNQEFYRNQEGGGYCNQLITNMYFLVEDIAVSN